MLVQNDFFDVYITEEQIVFLRLKKGGYPMKSFDLITRQHPRLKIESFPALRKALTEVGEEHQIGIYIPEIEIDISPDKLKAEITFNVTLEDFLSRREEILAQASYELDERGIAFGRQDLSEVTFLPGSAITAAVGREPLRGEDAVITYIEKPERKPLIKEDGSADYYDMNFVTPIEQGQWLGEKVPPQEGIPGIDVFGHEIPAQRGSDAFLEYDRKSVFEVQEGQKIVLRASRGGALDFIEGNLVSVNPQLVINGDVGPETGSITFDGAVRVMGTVLAGYSVKATGDISIEGSEGVTNSKEICSSDGDLYIKGGVFGGGMSIIEAKGDIYIKHANDCKMFAQTIHVGLYIFGSHVVAERVAVDTNQGKIIGGRIEALYSIECAYAGNQHERLTHLSASGIDKDLIYKEIQHLAIELKEVQGTTSQLEKHVSKFEGVNPAGLKAEQRDALEKMQESIGAAYEKMFELDREIQHGMRKMRDAEPPKIFISKEAYPGVVLSIGQKSTTLTKIATGTFEMIDDVLNV